MAAPVVWLNKWTFRVRSPNGRATDVTIPGAERLDATKLKDLVEWQTEETLEELRGPEPISPAHSKTFQHDLGKTLTAIDATKTRIKETGHGRYW